MSNRMNSQELRVTFSRHQCAQEEAAKVASTEFQEFFVSSGGHAQAVVSQAVPALPLAPPPFAPRRPRQISNIADVEPLSYPLWLPPSTERSSHLL
jgi:hypothetical protein